MGKRGLMPMLRNGGRGLFRSRYLWLTGAISMVFIFAGSVTGQVIVTFQNNNSGSILSVVPGLTATPLTRGNGAVSASTPCPLGFTSSGISFMGNFNQGTTGYIGFKLKPTAGKLHLARLNMSLGRSANGVRQKKIGYSLDGSTWTWKTDTVAVPFSSCLGTANHNGDWVLPGIVTEDTVFFRIYGYNANAPNDFFQVFGVTVEGSLCDTTYIEQQPSNVTVNHCDAASFHVQAHGTNLQFQWQLFHPGATGWVNASNGAYPGANTSTMVLPQALYSMNGNMFRCIVTGDCPPVCISSQATLTVLPSSHPDIITTLQSNVCSNDSLIRVNVTNFTDVAAVSMVLYYDTAFISHIDSANINPNVYGANPFIICNSLYGPPYGGQFRFALWTLMPINIGDGVLFDLSCHLKPGLSSYEWSPDVVNDCIYSNLDGCPLPGEFVSGTLNIIVPPVKQDMNGGGFFCQGHAGRPVGLDNSQPGVNYQLERNGTFTGSPVPGTGSAISFGYQSLPGTYTVLANNPATGCSETMNGHIVLEYDQVPQVFHVSGNGTGHCAVAPGREIVLDNSELYVNYSLKLDGVTLAILPGTGAVLSFGYQSASGTYTVSGEDSCTSVAMDGSLVIDPLPAIYNVLLQGLPIYCQGSSSATSVALSGSDIDVAYMLYRNGTQFITTLNGTGSSLTFTTVQWGTYTVNARNLNTLCENEMSGSVVVTEVPATAADAGPPAFNCGSSLFTVTDAVAFNYDSLKWVCNGSGVLENGNSLTPSYTPSAMDISGGSVLLTLTAYGHFPCGNVVSPKTLYIHHAPLAEAGPSAAICAGQTYTVAGASYQNGTALWTSSGSGSFSNNGTASPTYIPSTSDQAAGSVWLRLTVSGPPPCMPVRDSLLLTIHPSPNVVMTPFPDSICSNLDSVHLNNGSPAGGTYSGPGVLNNVFYPVLTGPGTFNISYSYTNGSGCSGGMTQPLVVKERYTISGNVTYQNPVSSPLSGTEIKLRDSEGFIIDTLVTGLNGSYKFYCLGNDDYSYIVSTSRPWGGGTAADAMLIARHVLGLQTFNPLQQVAADVDNNSLINVGDALLICRRFLETLNYFPAGDWAFEENNLHLSGSSLVRNFKGLCIGDIDGSNVPGARKAPGIILAREGILPVHAQETVKVPITIQNDAEVGSFSLVVRYPEDEVEITGVNVQPGRVDSGKEECLEYHAGRGELRVAWFSVIPRDLKKGEELLSLNLKYKTGNKSTKPVELELGDESEITDSQAQSLCGIILATPVPANDVFSAEGTLPEVSDLYLGPNRPNPFSHMTEIDYSLPVSGVVSFYILNSLGEKVYSEAQGIQPEGTHMITVKDPALAPGIYFYRVELKVNGKRMAKTRLMVLEK